ncbi:MAG: long-chain-fatty-acid--CoA ligase [Chloroflexota bacterium]|nr:long-chain-fatty-acid--CoA ligase [Chloroflexota bacterium]
MRIPLSVLEFRDRAAALFGNVEAVIDGERRFTYAQYAERTHRMANALRGLGVQPGDRVTFISYNCHQLLEAYYGVLEAGAVLNPVNIRLAPPEIGYILDHAGTTAVFYHADFRPMVEALRPGLPAVEAWVVLEGPIEGPATHEYEALLARASPAYEAPEVDEDAMAELFYTSGTTGRPKGVVLTHRNLYLHALDSALALRVTDADTMLHVVPLFHVNGWGAPHWMTLVGGRHVMLRKFDAGALLRLVAEHGVTYLLGVPTIFNAVVNSAELGEHDLSSLKVALIGGSPASPTLVRTIEEKLGCQAIVGYGLSETTPILSLAWPRAALTAAEAPEMAAARQAMTGYAIAGVNLRVVDQDGADVRPDGEQIGEIVARSNTVMDGYYGDPEGTAEKIRDGWFHTGDMATIDEAGYILIKDRSKDIIIRGGENISSVEIENAFASHPAVLEVAVVAAPDDRWGEVPVALVVLKPDAAATPQELRTHVRTQLADFKVPRMIEFRDALPKGGTGKVLKAELREPFWAGRAARVN